MMTYRASPAVGRQRLAHRPASELHSLRQQVRSSAHRVSSIRRLTGPPVCQAASTSVSERAQGDVRTAVKERTPEEAPFSWTKQWYAVGVLADMDKTLPTPARVLGGKFVLWHDENEDGQWHCQADLCPHRLAPLSEGKVVGNTLQCSYHGWRFSGDGALAALPQATPDVFETAKANSKSCVMSFPVREQMGLLWVWPDSAEARWIEAAATPTAQSFPPESTKEDPWWENLPVFRRDFPYGVRTFLDNTMDPSHVPWSHHGVIGDRTTAEPLVLKTKGGSKEGIECSYSVSSSGGTFFKTDKKTDQELRFQSPAYFRYDGVRADGSKMHISSFNTPTVPGRTLSFGFSKDTRQDPFNKFISKALPTWMSHLIFLKAGDGDAVLLRGQERLLPLTEHGWRTFYMPTQADSMVAKFNSWADKFMTKDNHPYMLTPPDEPKEVDPDKRDILNRWDQHTKHCRACSGAATNFGRIKQAATAAGIVAAFLASFAALGMWTPSHVPLVQASGVSIGNLLHVSAQQAMALYCGLAAGIAFSVRRAAQGMVDKFHFEDYVHGLI